MGRCAGGGMGEGHSEPGVKRDTSETQDLPIPTIAMSVGPQMKLSQSANRLWAHAPVAFSSVK